MTTAPTSTTATGRLRLAKLDKDRIATEARAEVVRTLDSIEDDDRRLTQATKIIDAANGFLADNEPRMKNMALHLAINENAIAVDDATSMSRYAFYKLRLEKKGPARVYRTAATDLPPLATKVIEAHAQREEATKYRDEIVVRMVHAGRSHGEVAQLIGRERSRVTQIVSAASKRV